ncbi:MAG: acyl-CoA synthetase [Candidatus Eremiobacteraeota bacterium]|nr:acyl-CoA synthetase [Candidatus Eremiobacteraeota bacterium]
MKHPSFHAVEFPDKVAYRMADTGEALTYAERDEASNRCARLLRAAGLRPGDHIALLVENSLDFFKIVWGAQRSGIYYTTISTHLTASEIVYILGDCGARVFFASARLLPPIVAGMKALDPSPRVITVAGRATSFETLEEALEAQPPVPVDDEMIGLDMLYSSGTTGVPKGVKAPFLGEPLGTVTALTSILGEQMCGMDATTVYLSPAPLYHAAPLRFAMLCGSLGATTVVMRKFDAETFLNLIATHRITHSQVVPTMFVRLLKLPAEVRAAADVSSLKAVVHAAAPCPADVKAAIIDWWGPILVEYYAGTEANGVTIIDSQQWLTHRGSVGRSFVGSIKILGEDPESEPLGPHEVGQIYFADGPKFAYLNAPEKTAQAHNSKGWSTLGDVGYLDEEGYLYLTDRKSYTIITGGVNVYPQETENVLIGHPAVLDVAVFGVPDAEMGEQVKAVVKLVPGQVASADLEAALIGYCRQYLSSIKSPRSIDFVDDLPRTPTGKLVKRVLRDPYWTDHTQRK